MRNSFKLLIHETDGKAFERLFVKIIGHKDPEFRSVRPYGNLGDKGNDGWVPASGKYYQVYAPEEIAKNSDNAIKKMKEDFAKLISYWSGITPVRDFYYVINDKYRGAPPHIFKALSELQAEHNLRCADVIGAQQIEEMLFSMKSDIIETVIGLYRGNQNPEDFYKFLVDEITKKLYLRFWPSVSDNLISMHFESQVADGFSGVGMLLFKTTLPGTKIGLESAILELNRRVDDLLQHFIASDFAYLVDTGRFWTRDSRWRGARKYTQDEYNERYAKDDQWRNKLFDLHWNLVHALNLFAAQVRDSVYPHYFMRQSFTVVDSLGTHNNLHGYEAIPDGFRQ